jgi:hypothetical protein
LTVLRPPREPFASSFRAVAQLSEAPILTLPDPVPRIVLALRASLPKRCCGMGPAPRWSGDSLPAGLDATGGDSNPACSCGRFSTAPSSSGWPHARHPCGSRRGTCVPSLAADLRRARYLLASHGSTVA